MPKEIEEEEQETEPETDETAAPPQKIPFPWMMAFIALFIFDVIEFVIPPAAVLFGLILGYWQKLYTPKADISEILLCFLLTRSADAVFLGILPSNLAIVVIAFFRKKMVSKVQATPALKKLAKQTA